jgi:hypothetical protein
LCFILLNSGNFRDKNYSHFKVARRFVANARVENWPGVDENDKVVKCQLSAQKRQSSWDFRLAERFAYFHSGQAPVTLEQSSHDI